MIPVFILAVADEDRRSKYEEAYIRFSRQLRAAAFLVLRGKAGSAREDQTQAEDVVQEVFRYALEKDILPDDPEQVKALLLTITKHMALDVLRKNSRLAGEEPTEAQLGYAMPEQSSRLALIVDAMPDIYKEVLILHYEYGYKAKEIAEMLKTEPDTIYKRLERARALVKEEYLKDI